MIRFQNVGLILRVIADNLSVDPFVFALQVARRLPGRLVSPVARVVKSAAAGSSWALPVLFAEVVSGDRVALARRLDAALKAGVGPRRASRLAELAIAANDVQRADLFLAASVGSAGHAPAKARRLWHDGAMSEAIATLTANDGPLKRHIARRQRERLESEAAILKGWVPELQPRQLTPVPHRVLHLLTNSVPHTQSGYAKRSHAILLAQQAAGWETLAVTRLGYPVLVGKLAAGLEDVVDGVRYRRLLPPRLARTASGRLQQQAEELLELALEFRPSVIHTTTHHVNGIVARAVAEALDIPWVYEVRGQLADTWASTRGPQAKESERYRLFQEREAESMTSAALVVTLGQAMKDNIVAAGVPEEGVVLAPNAVGGDYLLEPPSMEEARRKLGLDVEARIIGTVSSLVDYEGLDDLVSAFQQLASEDPGARLVIVGDGVSRPALQHQAKAAGLGSKVIFTGRVSGDLARLYHASMDIFVVPRKNLDVTNSVTPLKPVEAMACARPVVASDLPALREIIVDGETGLLAPAGDPWGLSRSLAVLLADAPLRNAMGRAGRKRVLATRTWAANAAGYARAYGAMTEEQRRRTS